MSFCRPADESHPPGMGDCMLHAAAGSFIDTDVLFSFFSDDLNGVDSADQGYSAAFENLEVGIGIIRFSNTKRLTIVFMNSCSIDCAGPIKECYIDCVIPCRGGIVDYENRRISI